MDAAPETVILRPFEASDAEPFVEAARESIERVYPWLPWCHPGYTVDESRGWIAHCAVAWTERREWHFAIVEKPTGRLLGGCGLNELRAVHGIANLGYWVRTSATGRGVATAAVRRIAAFAFRETDLARLEIVVACGNVASRRVAEKAGALREGVAHDRLLLQGRRQDAVMYALLRGRHADPHDR